MVGPARKDERRVAAACTSCGRVYASWRTAEGTISPIGNPDGCLCGSSEFEILGDDAPVGGTTSSR